MTDRQIAAMTLDEALPLLEPEFGDDAAAAYFEACERTELAADADWYDL